MFHEFLAANREEILERARTRVAARDAPVPTELELEDGLPVFVDQLGDALRRAEETSAVDHASIKQSASRHGGDLWRKGLTVKQVVHDYGRWSPSSRSRRSRPSPPKNSGH